MARDSVGEIALDLSLNSNGFKKQLSGIANMAKKAGAMIASAFAVKKLVEFGKSCIELGSDLSEVQERCGCYVPADERPGGSVREVSGRFLRFVGDNGQEVHWYFRRDGEGVRLYGRASLSDGYISDRSGW